jgi:hypothetical protein
VATNLPGILRIEDLNVSLTSLDVEIVEEGITALLAAYEAERNEAQSLFVESETSTITERIRAGSIDEGQLLGPDGRPLETRTAGYYDVGYPLLRLGWALGWNQETFAYMTVGDLDREVGSKLAGNARRHTREMFRALMVDDNYDYVDDVRGTVGVKRLANGDTVEYAPNGNFAGGTDDHYYSSGYANTAISAVNNPFLTLANDIREHFSDDTRVVAFINVAQQAEIQADLPSFVDANIVGIQQGSTTAVAIEPGLNVPGTFLGVDGASGVYVYVWNRIPANYIYAQAVDEAAPLRRRIPGPESLRGFRLQEEESHLPFYKRSWLERFGYGVSNRLAGAAMFLDAGATYTDPTF